MNVDREQQREILNLLFEHYPWRSSAVPRRISEMIEEDEGRTIGNILYLQMHGLIEPCIEIRKCRRGFKSLRLHGRRNTELIRDKMLRFPGQMFNPNS